MSCRNDINGTTTMVTPVEYDAGNINNTLLPPPVPMMTTTGLFCRMMAWITGFCTLQNCACSPNNAFNYSSTFTINNRFYCWYSSLIASLCAVRAALVRAQSFASITNLNYKNQCYALLTRQPSIYVARQRRFMARLQIPWVIILIILIILIALHHRLDYSPIIYIPTIYGLSTVPPRTDA
ncbi:hypothetical protein K469DRAFT_685451 [Zopfia rhizophila CBS 207.26]|uniref:Uncharacterized protein n=1 Tax=Zopfia rhizophila CBS 207.26 TaxID=1314779 RepID=A0A6A6E6T4_9PEZI|nr:hypothetical protein K469DRAFT_685451 [Zopfia rhizophila CBS 207.26]